jgi:hypothetical protein
MSTGNGIVVPGLLPATQQGMLAGNPRDSAIAEANAANQKLQSLQSIGGSRKYKLKRGVKRGVKRGGADQIPIPQFTMQYTPQGGPDQTPNNIIKLTSVLGTQSAENSIYDNFAMKKGGKKSTRKTYKKKRTTMRKLRRSKTRKHKKSNK